jgi:Tol biopolymer transport system component/imidazolonepropionase-like amidohydrolase
MYFLLRTSDLATALCSVVNTVSRSIVFAAAAVAGFAAQDFPVSRQIDLTITEGTAMAAAVSPDRRSIAIDLLGSIWLVPIRGGEARRITPELLEARQPTWSPDAQSIAFQGYEDGTWHIYVVNRDGGEPKALTQGEFDDREPAWSHDGSRIAFSSDRVGGVVTVWELALATGALRRVGTGAGTMPSWSPSDQEIAFVTPEGGGGRRPIPALVGVNADGRERLILPVERDPVVDTSPVAAGWSPDGTQIAYTSQAGQLFLGTQRISANDEDVFPFRPQWISRTEFVYTADGTIKRRSVDGAATTIPFSAKVTLRRDEFDIAHRPLQPTTPQRLAGIVSPAVSPDGRAVAFTAMGDLWMLPVGGTPVQLTNDEAFELEPAWSPDSTRIAFVSDRGGHMDLWVHDLRMNAAAQQTHERGAVSGPAWSHDGAQIAYLVNRTSIKTVRVGRGDCKGGSADGVAGRELGRPTWSPDCRSVAVAGLFPYSNRYREGLNQLLLASLESGTWSSSLLFPQHSVGNRQDTGPVWSRNGAHIAFVTEGKLWTIGVDQQGAAVGPPSVVADDQPESPSWEGDSRHIVYQTPNGLRRILADGSPPDAIPLDLTWRTSAPPDRLVVHAGHMLDGVLEARQDASDIVIERGVIRSVGAHKDELHSGAVVDAAGETVMPGLIDMHAHLDDGYGANFGKIWLAYGITSVRIPSVNPYAGLEQREAFDAGRRPGPRVFVSGDSFDGARIYYPGAVSIRSDEQLEEELDRASALGVDFFKTYVRLPDRLQNRIVRFAHAQGKPVTSHEIYPAIALGIDGVEHLRGTSRRGYSTKSSVVHRAYQDVVGLLGKSGVTLTPTIGIEGAFRARSLSDKTLLYDQRLSLFPLPVVAMLADLAEKQPDPALDRTLRPYETTLRAVAAAGGTIIAGTDSPIIPYGLGLLVELESYVHAGLTPFQALQTATVNAANALGLGNDLGTIEPGKTADLAFVTGDPLVDIRAIRDVKRVMRGGRMFAVNDLLRR